jgi:hypothetical protein
MKQRNCVTCYEQCGNNNDVKFINCKGSFCHATKVYVNPKSVS